MAGTYTTNPMSRLSGTVGQLMYLQQMRNAPSELDKVLQQQEADELRRRAEAVREEGLQRQMDRDKALQDEANRKADLAEKKYQDEYGPGGLKEQDLARKQRETESLVGLHGAETTKAGAETDLARARTQGAFIDALAKKNKMTRDQAEDMLNDAQRGITFGQQQAMGDYQFSKDETDALERKYQFYGGDKLFKLPRNPQGGWAYDKTKLPLTMMDEKGQPSLKYATDLDKLQGAKSTYFKELNDYESLKKNPNVSPEVLKAGAERLIKMSAPTGDQFITDLAQDLKDEGAPDAAVELIRSSKQGTSKGTKAPTAGETTDLQDRLTLVRHIDTIKSNLQKLTDDGIVPTGHYRQQPLNFLADIEAGNPDVQVLRKELNEMVSMYMKMMHGRRFQQHEVAWILKSMPSNEDSVSVLNRALEKAGDNMRQDIRLRAGVLKSFGMSVGDEYDPMDVGEIMKNGGSPEIETSDSHITPELGNKVIRGMDILKQKYQKANIGGEGAFRSESPPANGPMPLAPGQQLGMSKDMPDKSGLKVEGAARRFQGMTEEQIQARIKQLEREQGVTSGGQ